MPEMKQLLQDYEINQSDIDNIRMAAPALLKRTEELADFHYTLLLDKESTARFFRDEKAMGRARRAFIDWFESLLRGEYNYAYYIKIHRAGSIHVQIGLPTYHVNIQILHIRNFLADALDKDFADSPETASRALRSLNKLLDLNLDIMTRSYREEEMKATFLTYSIDSVVLSGAKWFVSGFNMALVIGLIVIGMMVMALSAFDFAHLFKEGGIERGVLGTLGSLLILWVIIELLDTQIKHIKGSAFAIKVFVSVALVAELRHVLISSIENINWIENLVLAVTILILGFVYWLISKIENSQGR